jgi:hypothetical protein
MGEDTSELIFAHHCLRVWWWSKATHDVSGITANTKQNRELVRLIKAIVLLLDFAGITNEDEESTRREWIKSTSVGQGEFRVLT